VTSDARGSDVNVEDMRAQPLNVKVKLHSFIFLRPDYGPSLFLFVPMITYYKELVE
jgi:hypothetical protein